MNVHVLAVDWASHGSRLRAVREKVFIEEQGVDREIEWDGLDETASHFIALDESGQAVGTARLLPDGQIGRMAVLRERRGQHIGRRLLDTAIEHAKEKALTRVFLHAQTDAVGFYQKAGFVTTGETFMEAGIEHVSMELQLPIPFESDETARQLEIVNPDEPVAPQSEGRIIPFDSEAGARDTLHEILHGARRTVDIHSPDLDHVLFAHAPCVNALSAFARLGGPARLRILIEDSSRIVARGHPLIALARRLSSKISALRIPEDLRQGRHTYVVADERGVWLQPDSTVYTGWANPNDPVEGMRLTDNFNYLFDRSVADPELRQLSL